MTDFRIRRYVRLPIHRSSFFAKIAYFRLNNGSKIQTCPTIKEITTLVSQLSEADQAALLKALKAQVLLQARRLDESVNPN
jgi:hypothetical protein